MTPPVPAPPRHPVSPWQAYKLRLKRRRLLWRAFRARHALTVLSDRTSKIAQGDILVVMVVRNEGLRLEYFLNYYRDLGVSHFLVVDNASTDGSDEVLAEQPDVSIWQTQASYRDARFGLDWMTWLQIRHAHDHWCLMVDADELLVYPGMQTCRLPDLTNWLDDQGIPAFGALMLDLYPKCPLDQARYNPGRDPTEVLDWFDPTPYRAVRQSPLGNLWVQGGARERAFFADDPRQSPTLNKLPLVRWNRRYAYVNSCHSILPPPLNERYAGPGGTEPSGVLLHTKFLPDIVSRSETEKQRGQHFHTPQDFDTYYDQLTAAPTLWHAGSVRLEGPDQLEALGLMHRGGRD